MKKYGFIYIWYDRKRKMWYIGKHWGHINDGYVCSSKWMRDAYRYRRHDFKRRIIEKVENRNQLAEVEYKWLQMIPDEELGVRYYNLRKHMWGCDEHSQSMRDRLSVSKFGDKNPMKRPEVRTKQSESLKRKYREGYKVWNHGLPEDDPRIIVMRKKQAATLKAKYDSGKIQPWNKGKKMDLSPEARHKMAWALGKKLGPRSEEVKKKSGAAISATMKRKKVEGRAQVPWNKGKRGVQVSAMMGKHHTEGTKKKLSDAMVNSGRTTPVTIHGVFYVSIAEAKRALGLSKRQVHAIRTS